MKYKDRVVNSSKIMAKIESVPNAGENGKRKTMKRKLSAVSNGNTQPPRPNDEEQTHEEDLNKDEDLMGTIGNEGDSSGESDNESVSYDGQYIESDDEDEELSFEDDDEDEENDLETDEKSSGTNSKTDIPSTSHGKVEDSKMKKFAMAFNKMTSISKHTRNAKNRNNKFSAYSFVRPNPESLLSGQTEVEEFEKDEDENKTVLWKEAEETDTLKNKGATDEVPNKIVLSKEEEHDEYEDDTSDEEDIRNTVGNIPMNWYDDYKHIGYNWEGKKIIKPPRGDELDNFLKKMDDPNFWRTVKDPQTGQDVILCDADAELINRLQNHKIPDSDFDEYAPWIEWFTSEVMKTPLRKFPEHKRSFIPSKNEARQVGRIVHAIKMGWIKPRQEKPKEPQFYMLWENDDSAEHMRRIHNHIPAPKRHLPNHAESYNPPPEYLFDKREMKEWRSLKRSPGKRKLHFVPCKYSSLREVPIYENYVKERFLRCMDLYLCPRARKMRLLIQPEDLVPQLPSPKDLQPFPTTLALVYKGHSDMVRCITVEPKGQYLASGSDDLSVKIWEVATARCVRTIPAGGVVRSISWCPNTALSLLAVAADRKLLLINPNVGDTLIVKKTDALLEEAPEQDVLVPEKVKAAVQWEQAAGEEWKKGIRIIINHCKEVRQVTWHGRGDYFATVMPEAQNRSVLIHQISKRRSQIPFNRAKGLVQCVLFHPIRPVFFVATQKHVRIYDLVKQEIVKKLFSNSKWISTMAIHPGGDNLLVATYDRKILWFDLDLSTKPYQTLRLHGAAVRGAAFHKRYPLFASGSDDNCIIVSHGMVYNDLLQNPLIVPLKRMTYHEKENDFSVFEVIYHPSQPWLFSSGADGTVNLYT